MLLRRIAISTCLAAAAGAAWLHAQGRGGAEWTTNNADAQRTGWVRSDTKISKDSLLKPGAFQFLWKVTLDDNRARQWNSLTPPIHLNRINGYRGLVSLAIVGGSSDTIYAIDYDFGKLYWKTHINYSSSLPAPGSTFACPGGLTAGLTRPTPLAPAPARGVAVGGRGGRSGGAVGEPGRGAPGLGETNAGRGALVGAAPAPGATLPGGAGAATAPARGRAGAAATDAAYVVSSDGMLHALNLQNGADLFVPAPFVPPNAKLSGLILVNDVIYASSSDECGSVPNGVWAIDLGSQNKTVTQWTTGGASISGTAGPTVGGDGTLYAAVGDRKADRSSVSNAIVALEPKTLKVRDSATVAMADFNASPIVFSYKGKDLIAATGGDGRMYLLDGGSLKTPLFVTPQYSSDGFSAGALASWQDSAGTRWILAPAGPLSASVKFPSANGPVSHGSLVAFKLVDQNGRLSLEPSWASRDLIAPLPPVIVNGVVFAVSSGEYRSTDANLTLAVRQQRSVPAVLYALDGETGKELWNSGKYITSPVHNGGLSAAPGQVHLSTYNSTIYGFGFPIEK